MLIWNLPMAGRKWEEEIKVNENKVRGVNVHNYVMIQALENGVTIFGLTRGADTKFHHTEKLDQGEVLIAQFTSHTSAIKVRGKAKIFTGIGVTTSGS